MTDETSRSDDGRTLLSFAWWHYGMGHRYEMTGDIGRRMIACECGDSVSERQASPADLRAVVAARRLLGSPSWPGQEGL